MSVSNYKFFENKKCEFYPCHAMDQINCLFCYCPLYPIQNCGGLFTKTPKGIKDCSLCTIPHSQHGYTYVLNKLPEIKKLMDW